MDASGVGGFNAAAISQSRDKLFARLDANGDGKIDKSEFQAYANEVASRTGRSVNADKAFAALDPSGTGAIGKSQFAAGPQPFDAELRAALAQARVSPDTLAGNGPVHRRHHGLEAGATSIAAAAGGPAAGSTPAGGLAASFNAGLANYSSAAETNAAAAVRLSPYG